MPLTLFTVVEDINVSKSETLYPVSFTSSKEALAPLLRGQVLFVALCSTDELEPQPEQCTSSVFLSTDTVKLLHDVLVCSTGKETSKKIKVFRLFSAASHTLGGCPFCESSVT